MNLVNSLQSKRLNLVHRNKNKSADVLAFRNAKGSYIGEVFLNLQLLKFKKNRKRLYKKLIVHGICHLLGYDHQTKREFLSMRREEKRVEDLLSRNTRVYYK